MLVALSCKENHDLEEILESILIIVDLHPLGKKVSATWYPITVCMGDFSSLANSQCQLYHDQ